MSGALGERQRDRLLAVGAALFAGTLVAGARGIEDSLLSDSVGAGGVPQAVGITMAIAAVALFAKSFRGAVPASAAEAKDTVAKDAKEMPWPAVAARSAGLVLILVAYGLLLPVLGYAATVSLLVLASGRLAGAPFKPPLLLYGALSGPLLWAVFDRALQVRMPVGSLWG